MSGIRTPRRKGDLVEVPVAAGVRISVGTIVVSDGGYASPGRLGTGLIYLGLAETAADNTGGPAGAKRVVVRREGVFRWDNTDITQADLFGTAYISGDRSMTRSAAGASPAGVIVDVDDNGVWVDAATAAPGGAALTLVHSPLVSPAAERMVAAPGRIRGSVALDIGDLSAFTSITAGTLTIGGTMIAGIDLSGATTINEVVDTITTAVQLVLPTYTVALDYNPTGTDYSFYGSIRHAGGDVPAIGGSLEPLFGFAPPAARVDHMAASPNIVLPGAGAWSHLQFRFLGQSYRTLYWYVQSDFWVTESGSLAQYLAFNNSGGWRTASFNDPAGGALRVAALEAYNVHYLSIQYDPATGEISWSEERTQPTGENWVPSIDTLTVLGR